MSDQRSSCVPRSAHTVLGRAAVRAAVAGGAVGLAACGAGDRGATGPVVRDSAGIAIVENAAPAWEEAEAWRVAAEPEVEIGVLEGEPAYQLDRVIDAVRLSDGRIVVANGGTGELRYYAADGRHLRTAGGEGGGPGEFRWLGRLLRLPGDTILAADWGSDRLSVMDPAGEYVASRSAPEPTAHLDDGTLLVARTVRSGQQTPEPGYERNPIALVRYSAAGEALDTLAVLPGTESRVQMERSDSRVTLFRLRVPFGREFHVAAAADRIYAGAGDVWEVRVYSPDGAWIRAIRMQRPNPPVTGELIDRYRDEFLANASSENARRQFERFLAEVEIPESIPAYGDLHTDAGGRLWVRHYPTPGEDAPTWDVFDPDGRWLGGVETPAGLVIHDIGADYVLGVWKDELDVEHVRLHRIDKPGA